MSMMDSIPRVTEANARNDLANREAAAALRFIKSDDGQLLLAWMRRSSGLSDSPPAPEASDALLRHMSGRQWLVNTLLQLARKAE